MFKLATTSLPIVVMFAFGASTACSASEPDPSPTDNSQSEVKSTEKLQPPRGKDGPAEKPVAMPDQHGNTPAETTLASSTTVTVDGKSCAFAGEDVAIALGLDGHGWTVNARSKACSLALDISGVDDASYPQTGATTFLNHETVVLFTNGADNEGATFVAAGGETSITSGPKNGQRATVVGSAHVLQLGGSARHDVTFTFAFDENGHGLR